MMHISIMGDTSYIPTYNWEAPHCMRSFLMKVRTSVVYHMDADVMHIVSYTIYTSLLPSKYARKSVCSSQAGREYYAILASQPFA